MKQLDLFGGSVESPENKSKKKKTALKDYDEFVKKFKPKKTTDDCYTPVNLYDTVLQWVRENADIEGLDVLRPFKPGGDYEHEDYTGGCVVIDNPPFSILSEIVRFYAFREIRFFLFAPTLTLFSARKIWDRITYLPVDVKIVYENGAKVNTSFVSNLFGDVGIWKCPELERRIKEVQREGKAEALPKYEYPDCVVTAAGLKGSMHGAELKIYKNEMYPITALESQRRKGKGIFGGGFLISGKAAARKAAARKDAARKDAARKEAARKEAAIKWELSESEKEIIRNLGQG